MHALRAAADFRADRGLFDAGDSLTPSKHNGVIDARLPPQPAPSHEEGFRLAYIQRHFVASIQKDAHIVDDAIARLRGLLSPSCHQGA